jgi:hypothetical protein
MISLESVRALIDNPPVFVPGPTTAFCDFAGAGDESVLATCSGNRPEIIDAWRSRDTMHSVGKFLTHFRRLGLQGHQIGGDEGYGHQLMDAMQESNFYLQRINNGSQAKRADIYFNLNAEWWSIVGQLIERRIIFDPTGEHRYLEELRSCSRTMERSIQRNGDLRVPWVDWSIGW